jgi:hypothetical protein
LQIFQIPSRIPELASDQSFELPGRRGILPAVGINPAAKAPGSRRRILPEDVKGLKGAFVILQCISIVCQQDGRLAQQAIIIYRGIEN